MGIPWLATLPQCPLPYDGGETLGNNYAEFPTDVRSVPMRRQRSTTTIDTLQMVFPMSRDQVVSFKSYYRNDLRGGALPFIMDTDGGPADHYIEGDPAINQTASNRYLVSFSVRRVN
jgi:hypothetical protein